ncbi:MAG TPA: dihydropteroate synthase [Candidatus Competibacteraceae bacterium]|nr:dihydropteroate synthase [Candidatus Competibacteraceae bacterium]
MGVLNVTPDSFSDGGRFLDPQAALARAHAMVEEGADIIDIGGESTRPGAVKVSAEAEMDRVLPLLEVLARELPVPISVDTYKPEVMAEAIRLGAGLINDIYALRAPGALPVIAASAVPVCLMHMQGTPETMQQHPHYGDVVGEVKAFLADRVQACEQTGIARSRLLLDPGFGFGKTLQHNLTLLRHLDAFHELGLPLLVGLSRKSMIGTLTGRSVDERMHGSVAAAVLAAWQGAHIVRVHDVRATVDALKVCAAVAEAG